MRLFVALELPEEPRRAAAEVIRQLRRSGADLKWVAPENLHLTLKFLGETDPGRWEAITTRLEAACAPRPPLALALSGAGAFPGVGRPQVVWLGLGGQVEGLQDLAASLEASLADLGFAPEARAFRPHLTLGRARRGRGLAAPSRPLALALAGLADWRGPEFVGQRVSLMESTLTPAGPIYRPRWAYDLGPGPAIPT